MRMVISHIGQWWTKSVLPFYLTMVIIIIVVTSVICRTTLFVVAG